MKRKNKNKDKWSRIKYPKIKAEAETEAEPDLTQEEKDLLDFICDGMLKKIIDTDNKLDS
jgi:hypothetical protein